MSATRQAPSPKEPQQIFITWKSVTLFLAAIIALVAGWKYVSSRSGPEALQGMPALIEACSRARPIELRLSGGFRAGPFNPDAREGATIDLDKLKTARRLILERAQKSNDLQSKLSYARLVLCEETSASPQEHQAALAWAREHLTALAGQHPDNPEVQNEMGVCLFEQGNIEDIEEAVRRFDKAIELAPAMPEPVFNRAVCYRKLHLLDAAARDFARAKEIEKDNGWIDEIDARVEEIDGLTRPRQAEKESALSLEEAMSAGDMDGANRILNQSLESLWRYSLVYLPQEYMEARARKDSALASALHRRMELIGQAILKSKNDSFVQEFCAHLYRTPDSDVEIELKLLKDYWAMTLKGARLDNSGMDVLKRVSEECKSRGNYVLLALSDYSQAIPLLYTYRTDEARDLLTASLAMVEQHTWPLHRANTLVQLCNGYVRTGQLSLVIKICNEALKLVDHRPAARAKVLQYLGAAYWQLGNFDKSFRLLQESTDTFLTAGFSPSKKDQFYNDVAYNYLNVADIQSVKRNHSLALENLEQAVAFYKKTQAGPDLAEVLALKATEEANLGRFEATDKSLQMAFEVVAASKDGPGSYSEKWAQIRAGDIALQRGDWKQAQYYFTRANQKSVETDRRAGQKTVKKGGWLNQRIRALRGLAEASIKMGQLKEARQSLDAAIDLIEDYRAEIHESENRISYLDAVQSIYDSRVSLELQVFGNTVAAFNLAERSRARSLLDDIKGRNREGSPPGLAKKSDKLTNPLPSRPLVTSLRLKEIQSGLPEGLVLVMYVVTTENTFAFVVDRKSLNWKPLGLTSGDVEREVGEYMTELSNTDDMTELNNKGSRLYQSLIEPLKAWIPEGSTLCIVPDKSLNRFPMAALVDGSGRYLMESLTSTDAPSASVLIESLKKAGNQPPPKDERLLVVANASYSREEFPNLQNIADAETEARKTINLYSPDSIKLVKGQATEPRVKAAIKDCDVAHFALHVLVEERTPWLAGVVLASPGSKQGQADSDTDGAGTREARPTGILPALSNEAWNDPNDGLLHLTEIYNLGLTRTRLVILSGCQSGLGQFYRGEGMVSLVRPFLASNVPTVVASLWSVNSPATSTLMIDFHGNRKMGSQRAGDALRAAQMKMARGPAPLNHPYYWAPFIVVGGNN